MPALPVRDSASINMQVDQRQMRNIKTALAKMNQLRFAGVTVGSFDVVAEAWFKSSEEMLTFTSDVWRESRVSFGLSRCKFMKWSLTQHI